MKLQLFTFFILASLTNAAKFETPFLNMQNTKNELRIYDMVETVWVGLVSDDKFPVEGIQTQDSISLTLGQITCTAFTNETTCVCYVPPSGSLRGSGSFTQNGTTLFLDPENYLTTVKVTLDQGKWIGDSWKGTSKLFISFYQQTREQLSARLAIACAAFIPFTLVFGVTDIVVHKILHIL